MDKNQREYILREELKVIREELGDDNTMSDADEFQQAADALKDFERSKRKAEQRNQKIPQFYEFPGGNRRYPDLYRNNA